MATSPTSKSALLSGAAKDDHVGQDGDFTFTIADLLANDPGGAAKADVSKQFFFGSTAADQADQAGYMAAHGIIDNHDGTFTLKSDAIDFDYFVQIGNRGTWSVAHVDVTAPPPEPHQGDLLFSENFDGYINLSDAPQFGVIDLNAKNGWTGAAHTELGANGYANIPTTSGDDVSAYWLDTQNSPGPIDISHGFDDPTGGQVQLSFDISLQNIDYQGKHYETDPNAAIEFRIDGNAVASISYGDLINDVGFNAMKHFDVVASTGAAGNHTLEIADLTNTYQDPNSGFTGFAVDTIQVHDWLV